MDNRMYNYPNYRIDRIVEQMQQIESVATMMNTVVYQDTIKLATTVCIESNKIMQQYLANNVIENVIRPTLRLYQSQMNKILEVIPTVIADNLYNTLSTYKNIISEINFNDIIINDNGTIEYGGNIYTENEIEETSEAIVEEINTKGNIKIESFLKKFVFCILSTILISFLQADDFKYLLLMVFSGFLSQPGADAYSFLKSKFMKTFKRESVTNEYFDNYSGLVQIDNLKLRKKPNKESKVIINLEFGSSVEIKNQLKG